MVDISKILELKTKNASTTGVYCLLVARATALHTLTKFCKMLIFQSKQQNIYEKSWEKNNINIRNLVAHAAIQAIRLNIFR